MGISISLPVREQNINALPKNGISGGPQNFSMCLLYFLNSLLYIHMASKNNANKNTNNVIIIVGEVHWWKV